MRCCRVSPGTEPLGLAGLFGIIAAVVVCGASSVSLWPGLQDPHIAQRVPFRPIPVVSCEGPPHTAGGLWWSVGGGGRGWKGSQAVLDQQVLGGHHGVTGSLWDGEEEEDTVLVFVLDLFYRDKVS